MLNAFYARTPYGKVHDEASKAEAARVAVVLERTGHRSLYHAAEGDLAAVQDLVAAGAGVEQQFGSFTAVFGACEGGHMNVLAYLVETCGASLKHMSNRGSVPMHHAAIMGHLDIVKYVAKKEPTVVDIPSSYGTTPLMYAAAYGHRSTVCHLCRLGCSISLENPYDGHTALDYSRLSNGKPDTVRLLEAVGSAGGWRKYVAARRMRYVRIRHEVSSTYTVLPDDHKLRELYHFVFGKNEVLVANDGAEARRVAKRADSMMTLPGDLFAHILRMLVS